MQKYAWLDPTAHTMPVRWIPRYPNLILCQVSSSPEKVNMPKESLIYYFYLPINLLFITSKMSMKNVKSYLI